jgi:hypothetical protein
MARTNSQSLSTRDIVVVVASALVLVASFLPVFSLEGFSSGNAWSRGFLVVFVLGYAAAVAVGVLVLLERLAGVRPSTGRLGLSPGQLTGVLATVSLITFVLTWIASPGLGIGVILGLLGAILLFVVVLFGDRIPALSR